MIKSKRTFYFTHSTHNLVEGVWLGVAKSFWLVGGTVVEHEVKRRLSYDWWKSTTFVDLLNDQVFAYRLWGTGWAGTGWAGTWWAGTREWTDRRGANLTIDVRMRRKNESTEERSKLFDLGKNSGTLLDCDGCLHTEWDELSWKIYEISL